MSTKRVCCSFAKAYRAEAARVKPPVEGGDMESDSYDDSESYESSESYDSETDESGKTDTLILYIQHGYKSLTHWSLPQKIGYNL